jgi:hypothetical protein
VRVFGKISINSILLFALMVCSPSGAVPTVTNETATVVFQKGSDVNLQFGRATTLIYAEQNPPLCEIPRANYAVFAWGTRASISRSVVAGRTLHIAGVRKERLVEVAGMINGAVVTSLSEWTNCAGAAVFTPVAGKTYVVSHSFVGPNKCHLTVIEQSQGLIPVDLLAGSWDELMPTVCTGLYPTKKTE